MQEKTTKIIEGIKSVIGKEKQLSPSPFMNWLKPVAVAAEYGSLTFEYKIREEMTNPMGHLHGGVIAGIIDDIMGATVYSLEKSCKPVGRLFCSGRTRRCHSCYH